MTTAEIALQTGEPAHTLSAAIWTHVRSELPAARQVDELLAEQRVLSVVQSGAADGLLSRVADSLHTALLDSGAGDVKIDLSREQGFINSVAQAIDPSFATSLPPAREWGSVLIVQNEQLPNLGGTARLASRLWPATLAGMLALAALALAGAYNRLRAMGFLGFVTAAIGAVILAVGALVLVIGPLLMPSNTGGLLVAGALPTALTGLFAVGALFVLIGLALGLSARLLERRRAREYRSADSRTAMRYENIRRS